MQDCTLWDSLLSFLHHFGARTVCSAAAHQTLQLYVSTSNLTFLKLSAYFSMQMCTHCALCVCVTYLRRAWIRVSHLWRLPIWAGIVWRLLQERLSSVRVRISHTHSGNTPRRLWDKFRLFSCENLKKEREQKKGLFKNTASDVTLKWASAVLLPEKQLKTIGPNKNYGLRFNMQLVSVHSDVEK